MKTKMKKQQLQSKVIFSLKSLLLLTHKNTVFAQKKLKFSFFLTMKKNLATYCYKKNCDNSTIVAERDQESPIMIRK